MPVSGRDADRPQPGSSVRELPCPSADIRDRRKGVDTRLWGMTTPATGSSRPTIGPSALPLFLPWSGRGPCELVCAHETLHANLAISTKALFALPLITNYSNESVYVTHSNYRCLCATSDCGRSRVDILAAIYLPCLETYSPLCGKLIGIHSSAENPRCIPLTQSIAS